MLCACYGIFQHAWQMITLCMAADSHKQSKRTDSTCAKANSWSCRDWPILASQSVTSSAENLTVLPADGAGGSQTLGSRRYSCCSGPSSDRTEGVRMPRTASISLLCSHNSFSAGPGPQHFCEVSDCAVGSQDQTPGRARQEKVSLVYGVSSQAVIVL